MYYIPDSIFQTPFSRNAGIVCLLAAFKRISRLLPVLSAVSLFLVDRETAIDVLYILQPLDTFIINSRIVNMKTPVVQEDDYGCAVACVAFVLNIEYQKALRLFPKGKSRVKMGGDFYVREIAAILNSQGKHYRQRYIKSYKKKHVSREGSIILIARNNRYTTGHYLVRHNGTWMDPWINLVQYPRAAGWRLRLPGRAMMGVFDESTGIKW